MHGGFDWAGIFSLSLEPISKMSFGPISLLVLRFKSSTYNSMPAVYDPQRLLDQAGNPATLENSVPPRF
jgi:hypothetical protein